MHNAVLSFKVKQNLTLFSFQKQAHAFEIYLKPHLLPFPIFLWLLTHALIHFRGWWDTLHNLSVCCVKMQSHASVAGFFLIKKENISHFQLILSFIFTLILGALSLFFSVSSVMASLAAPMWQATRWRSSTFCPTILSSTWSNRLLPPVCWCQRRMKTLSLSSQRWGWVIKKILHKSNIRVVWFRFLSLVWAFGTLEQDHPVSSGFI